MEQIRNIQSLCGTWDYRIGDGKYVKKTIPYSDAPVGVSECKLDFDTAYKADGKRVFLIFDGITYEAEATLNGKSFGRMLPYCEYRYEVTDIIKESGNCLSVIIRDTEIVFGAGEGWENYSGITRDVYLEYTSESIIEDVFWHSEVNSELTCADCTAEIKVDGDVKDSQIVLQLVYPNGNLVRTETAVLDSTEAKLEFSFDALTLWSPDSPKLYTLCVTLVQNGVAVDSYTCKVGFKRLETKDRRFYLNGKPFFLFGVCRHEMWGEVGHMITDEQIEQDLRMIKDTGCNYVRLVHYPHRKITLEIADRIGLLVSEEPGLWWSDMKDQSIVDASLEVLHKTIIRDRNHACLAFWLSFNECIFTPEYLMASAETCRKYDPYHMVSGANCMDIPMTKKHFAECGLDFYTMHPYHFSPAKMTESAKELTSLPLVFTEWGGYYVYESPFTMKMFVTEVVRLWQTGQLAGAVFWCWSEMYEVNRAAPACYDGLQCEGLVNRFREPTLAYETFKREFAKLNESQEPPHFMYLSEFDCKGECTALDISGEVQTDEQVQAYDRMMKLSAKPIPRFYYECRNTRHLTKGPMLLDKADALGQLPVNLSAKPVVLEEGVSIELAVGAKADKLHIVGLTSMPKGFPIDGKYGESIGKIEVHYADGRVAVTELRNGYEVTTAAAWYGPSRINPRAVNAERAIHFINDMDREHYVANLLTVPAEGDALIEKLVVRTEADGYCLLLYGVTLEKEA